MDLAKLTNLNLLIYIDDNFIYLDFFQERANTLATWTQDILEVKVLLNRIFVQVAPIMVQLEVYDTQASSSVCANRTTKR